MSNEKEVKEIREDIKQTEEKIDKEIKKEEKHIDELKEDKKQLEKLDKEIEQEEVAAKELDKNEQEFKEEITHAKKDVSEVKEDVEGKDEETLDFSKIKDFFKGLTGKKTDQQPAINWTGAGAFFKNNKWIIPTVLIIIAIFFSIFFRMYPAHLPTTDDWAESTVYGYFQDQIKAQINQQYPNLPAQNKNALVDEQFNMFLQQNKDMVDEQIKQQSNLFKERLKDDDGQTYLLAIDPYHWFSMARNYEESDGKNYGDSYYQDHEVYEDGTSKFSLRNGREGKALIVSPFNSWVMAFIHKIAKIFDRDMSLMAAAFLLPVIIIALSIIPVFFIARKVGGNLGGFFAAMIVAVNSSLLSRTPAGFSDTDAYNIFFPLMIMWLFFEAFEAKDSKKSIILMSLSGLFVGIFAFAWRGWWYIFDFILATVGLYFIYLCVIHSKDIKKGIKHFVNIPEIKNTIISGIAFVISSGFFVTIILGRFDKFISAPLDPLDIVKLKEVAVNKLWPNVLTTVAEFNVVPLKKIISQMGGDLLFTIAIAGIILTLFWKNNQGKMDIKYAIFLTIWFIGTAYGFTRGVRFAILMVPAFAIAFGVAIGITYKFLNRWLSKELYISKIITSTILILLFSMLLIAPVREAHGVALHEVPSFNDAWQSSLNAIKNNATDGVITSWWDFGHWFYAMGERRVTFDGADQGERIHWVGKTLLTDNETLAVGILRMLNCGQEKAPHVLESYIDDDTVRAIDILDSIMVKDREKAAEILSEEGLTETEIEDVLATTHCPDLIPQYYIASEDMVSKSGVWGHFGSWDFRRAEMWQNVSQHTYDKGIEVLTEKYNLTDDDADRFYYEITGEKADAWVSPWPSYMSAKSGCSVADNTAECLIPGDGGTIKLLIDLETYDVTIPAQNNDQFKPASIVYAEGDEVKEKKFEGKTTGFSLILVPSGNSYYAVISHPLQAYGMFTRMFYFEGHGLKHFRPLVSKRQITGQMIYVYKVEWDESEPYNKLFPEPEAQEEIRASHILITLENRTDQEALALARNVSKQINSTNFAEIAEKFSEGPSGPSGGDLGWFTRGMMVPEFEDAAFALEKDQVSGAIKTQFGYHIIKVIDIKDEE